MSQHTKSAYYNALKAAGVKFDKHYRDYTLSELREAYDRLAADVPPGVQLAPVVEPPPADMPQPRDDVAELRQELAGLTKLLGQLAKVVEAQQKAPDATPPQPPEPKRPPKLNDFDPAEHAGVTLNSHGADEPIRVDPDGTQWFRNEVNKPSFPKPRGRRVLRAMDPGTVTETIKVGEYTETFEIPGDPANAKPIEVKVTLPSYQTGIYKPKNMPFKIHTYQGVRGFDFDDVNKFYGGVDLVPSTIKRCYVSSDLCYDITTVIRAIQDEYRERVLRKETIR